jgi:lipopolysaccharide export system permease protein
VILMTTLDRVLFAAFLRSYAIVLVSLLSLYVVIDLFTNLDDFVKTGDLRSTAAHIGLYYGPRLSQIYDRLAEAVTLLAAMFTVAWVQRNNELLPQLSAGLSTHRVLRPVLVGTVLMAGLPTLNQELVIPRIKDLLQIPKDDPDQTAAMVVTSAFDSTGVHIEGMKGYRKGMRVEDFYVTFPETGATGMAHLQAGEAVYRPSDDPLQSGWELYNTTPEVLPEPLPETLRAIGPRRYFLNTRDADFDSLTRGSNWYALSSTTTLRQILARPDPRRMAPVAVVFHMRFTRPLVGAVMVLFGLAIILRDQNRHVLISAGLCLVMCGVFYAVVFGCKYLGENELLAPALSAWLPVLVFGPLAIAQFDAVQT